MKQGTTRTKKDYLKIGSHVLNMNEIVAVTFDSYYKVYVFMTGGHVISLYNTTDKQTLIAAMREHVKANGDTIIGL